MQKHEKKFSIAFIKYFSKLIRQMKGILFIDSLVRKHFLDARSRQSSGFTTNQPKRTSANARANEISRYKSQIKVQIVSEQESVV